MRLLRTAPHKPTGVGVILPVEVNEIKSHLQMRSFLISQLNHDHLKQNSHTKEKKRYVLPATVVVATAFVEPRISRLRPHCPSTGGYIGHRR
jgi:hypothetical protein